MKGVGVGEGAREQRLTKKSNHFLHLALLHLSVHYPVR